MSKNKKLWGFDMINKDVSISTKMTRWGREPEEQHGFVNTPIYRGSTVIYKSIDDIHNDRLRFNYGTAGTPTIESLENAWSALSGSAGTVISPSGLGSIALALFSVTKAGDHILMPDSVYRPTRSFCEGMLKRFGVQTEYYDPMIGIDIEKLLKPNTSVIFLESPGSLTFEVQDIPSIVAVAKKHSIKTIMDNTWATPIFFKAHEHGIDLALEAGTKYLGGHSDLLMGLVSANEETWPFLRQTYDHMAMLPGAEDCFLALRGLRTMHLRLKEAEKRGLEIAHWLQARSEVAKILHPAFPECPGHENWQRNFHGSSGVFSIILDPQFTKIGLANMLDNMSIFAIGYSWGGFESLIVPFNCSDYRTVTKWQPEGLTIRLQIGLEDLDDLKNDLAQGLERLTKN